MTRVTKVLFQVRRRFWQAYGGNGRAFTDGLVQATYETTAGQSGDRAVLTVTPPTMSPGAWLHCPRTNGVRRASQTWSACIQAVPATSNAW